MGGGMWEVRDRVLRAGGAASLATAAVGVSGGMREARDCVLRAGGSASLATVAVWDRVFRAGVSAGRGRDGWAEWHRRVRL